MIAAVLQDAARWLAEGGRPLWSGADIGDERVLQDTTAGLFHVARDGEQMVGVMKFELEDAYFWPEVLPGTSAFIHKLAVRRAWAKKGVSIELLTYARARATANAPIFDWIASRTGTGCASSMRTSASRCTASFKKGQLHLRGTSFRRRNSGTARTVVAVDLYRKRSALGLRASPNRQLRHCPGPAGAPAAGLRARATGHPCGVPVAPAPAAVAARDAGLSGRALQRRHGAVGPCAEQAQCGRGGQNEEGSPGFSTDEAINPARLNIIGTIDTPREN